MDPAERSNAVPPEAEQQPGGVTPELVALVDHLLATGDEKGLSLLWRLFEAERNRLGAMYAAGKR